MDTMVVQNKSLVDDYSSSDSSSSSDIDEETVEEVMESDSEPEERSKARGYHLFQRDFCKKLDEEEPELSEMSKIASYNWREVLTDKDRQNWKRKAQQYNEQIDCGQIKRKCKHCNKRFKKEKRLASHEKGCRESKCEVCEKVFANQDLYRRHYKTHWKAFRCEQCPKEFSTAQGRKRHQLTHENTPGKFVCDICKKAFKTSSNLYRHVKTHNN